MDDPLFRFENLEGAMSMFKYLVTGIAIDIDRESLPDGKTAPDKDNYVPSEYVWVSKGEQEYHLGSEIIEVYEPEEFNKLKKERDEWLDSFKKKGGIKA